jgi:hypothetical protein
LTNDRYDWTQGDGFGDFNILDSGKTVGLSFGTVSGGAGAGNSAIWTKGSGSGSGTLTFGTNQTAQMTIDASGRVGIGTTTPGANYRLDVRSAGLSGAINVDGVLDNARNRATDGSAAGASYGFINNENMGMYRITTDTLGFTTAGNERMRINATGNVGIGKTPTVALDVSGDIKATGNITAYSDERFKTNIYPIMNALEKVSKMRGVSYTARGGNNRIGVIAQEIEKIIPEVVLTDDTEEHYKSVDYGNIVAVLIEAIKELNAKVDALSGA